MKTKLFAYRRWWAALLLLTSLDAYPGPTDETAAETAQEAELAKQLQNPVASLISVPFQNNWDFGIGRTAAMRYMVNVQPVIPFSIGDDWNLITRTIVPFIHAEAPMPGGQATGGIGDILQSFFLSPKAPVGGWILGAGPALLYPTASDSRALGFGRWAAGPSAVALQQRNGWTYGLLANHLWSYAGWGPNDVDATFLQPFMAYTTSTFTTFTVTSESTYDWTNRQWLVPLNLLVQQLVKLGDQPAAFQVGGRYYPQRPEGGPDWGLRFNVTLLFPK